MPALRFRRPILAFVSVASLLSPLHAGAAPWLQPGDARVRHDVQLLADAGVLRAPVTTWPISWPDIARDMSSADDGAIRSPAVLDALRRLRRDAQRAAAPGFTRVTLAAAFAERPTLLRTFTSTPRAQGELNIEAGWLGDRTAANLDVAIVSKPGDDREVRLDGSYVGAIFGNFMLSAGAIERWWGPGHEGSLILSTNARPIPGIAIERNVSEPFAWKLLRWLGPWRASATMGQLEGSGTAVPDARFFAARVSFRPTRWLDIGLSRTAQWCGEGRPCGLETFADLLVGRDNRGDGVAVETEAGNQMAGYDARIRSPWNGLPVAIYAQMIGEDEAGGLPSKFLGLAGAELWGGMRMGSYRLHVEYADTSCSFSRSDPEFDCAYRNNLYPDGYAYRGRVIGHALDTDGRMYSAGVELVRPSGETFSLLVRSMDLNRAGAVPDPAHHLSPGPDDLENIELQYNHSFARRELRLGAGYDRRRVSGFIEWRQEF
jgi:hypothetical protein